MYQCVTGYYPVFVDSVPGDTKSTLAKAARRKKDRGKTIVQLILAALITLGAGLWAWSLAASLFAGPPTLNTPGSIGVAVEPSAGTESAPIDILVDYSPEINGVDTNVSLIFTQNLSTTIRKRPSPTIIVFLCGEIAQNPDFVLYTASRHQPLKWQGLEGCLYTTLAMTPHDSAGNPGAFMGGSFVGATRTASGTKQLYALPGVTNWKDLVSIPPPPLGGLKTAVMPPGSTLTVDLAHNGSDLTNVFADPQLSDTGNLTWTCTLADAPFGYTLEADSQSAISQLQAHLFIAGALVGVAGAGFLWLVQLCGDAGYGAIAGWAKRKKSEAEEAQASGMAPHVEAPESATPQSTHPVATGLGWPE